MFVAFPTVLAALSERYWGFNPQSHVEHAIALRCSSQPLGVQALYTVAEAMHLSSDLSSETEGRFQLHMRRSQHALQPRGT